MRSKPAATIRASSASGTWVKSHIGRKNGASIQMSPAAKSAHAYVLQPVPHSNTYGWPGRRISHRPAHRRGDQVFERQQREAVLLISLPLCGAHSASSEAVGAAKYRAKAAQLPPTAGPEFLPEGKTKTRQIQNRPVYAAMVESVDQSVGRIMQVLKRLGLEDNTIVVFNSDNGGLSSSREHAPTSNAPLRAGKGWNYEGGFANRSSCAGPVSFKPAASAAHRSSAPTIIRLFWKPPACRNGRGKPSTG